VGGVDIEFSRDVGVSEDRFSFGPKDKRSAVPRIAKRFDADLITCDEESVSASVPEGEREHAVETNGEFVPVFFVKVNEDFRIRPRLKPMASAFEIAPQFRNVVDLSVVHDDDVIRFVKNGLVTPLDVNDAQSPITEADMAIDIDPFRIRSPVFDGFQHRTQGRLVGCAGETTNATHDSDS
jgi:hypothetical protein